MAKGAYSFVAYPESSNIDVITAKLKQSGAEFTYILHDKDKYLEDEGEHKAGDLKKAHWHIIAGWESGFPNWKNFRSLCKEVGAVAPSFTKCFVQDCEGCADYFTHPNNPEKYQYPTSDIVSSEDWDCDAYQLADTRRKKSRKNSKVEKLCSFQEILCFIDDHNICNWSQLLQTISKYNPEYLETALQYGYGLTQYLNSLQDRSVKQLLEAHQEIERLREELQECETQLLEALNNQKESSWLEIAPSELEFYEELFTDNTAF